MDIRTDLRPGSELNVERRVDEHLVTRHVGGAGLFSTPAMIGLMEQTSNKLVEPHLPAGLTTVGYEVNVRHVAPTEPGSSVRVTSRLLEVDGNKLLFAVECREGETLVGKGTHRRAIVPARGPLAEDDPQPGS